MVDDCWISLFWWCHLCYKISPGSVDGWLLSDLLSHRHIYVWNCCCWNDFFLSNFLFPGDSSTPFKPGIFFFIVNAPWETPSCAVPSKFLTGLSVILCMCVCLFSLLMKPYFYHSFLFNIYVYLDVSLVEACFWNRAPWDYVHTCRRYLSGHWPTGMLSFYLATSTGHK